MTAPLRIGTRGSALALWQARHIAELLRPLVAPRAVDLLTIQTTGDAVSARSLSEIGGQGVFSKEIQRAVLDGRADIAVHSLKDLPTVPTPGLVLAAVPPRAAVGDAFVSHRYPRFDDLPRGAVVATGSPRRRAQLLHRRPDLHIEDLRGNVDTRLRKLQEHNWDGMILAQAGLERLGLASAITEVLDTTWMLPAVGQGALGVECRAEDEATRTLLQGLDHSPSRAAVLAERAFLRGLGGGCLLPVAALATVSSHQLALCGAVLSADGRQRLAGDVIGTMEEADGLGQLLAEQMLAEGAQGLLKNCAS